MFTRWFLNSLLIACGIIALLFGGYWWWSIQPPDLEPAGVDSRALTLANGLQLTLVSDPDAPASRLEWTWEQGVAHEPAGAPGVHELAAHTLLYGDTPTGYRHLRTRAQRDPDGQVAVRVDRRHTAVSYLTSAPVFAQEVRHFGELLADPAWPLDGIAVERSRLAHVQSGMESLTPAEWAALQAALELPVDVPTDDFREGLNNTAAAREIVRYAADTLVPGRMAVRLTAPDSLASLEALARDSFSALSAGGQPAPRAPSDWQWGNGNLITLPATEPVHSTDPEVAVPDLRLIYPWALTADLRSDADRLVRWLNTPYEQSPGRILVADEYVDELRAYRTDEALVVNLYGSRVDRNDLLVVRATLNRFLAQVTLPPEPTPNQLQLAGGVRIATDLRLSHQLLPDIDALSVLHHTGAAGSKTQIAPLPVSDQERALALQLPLKNREIAEQSIELEPNTYELIGWQPQKLVDDEGLVVWHYEDNRFGSQLVSAHIRLHWPIGVDNREQARWQRWAETRGPGWSEETLWAGQLADSAAVGHRVTADEQGLVWHFTAPWADVEAWLYQLFANLGDVTVDRPVPRPETRADVQLMRERAALVEPATPERLDALPVTALLMGRVDSASASEFADWWRTERPTERETQGDGAAAQTPFRLATEHQIAELQADDHRSMVTRIIQLPERTLRQQTLAEWTIPWVQETLTAAVRTEAFAGQLTTELTAPLGYPGLRLQLSSAEQDPARLGLYGRAFWGQLEAAVSAIDSDRFNRSTQWRAELLRESAQSLPTLANYHWEDITAGRRHFNGRTLRAQILEGTSSDGWQFFADEWLSDTAARQMTVFEIGKPWREDYQEARNMPRGAVPW